VVLVLLASSQLDYASADSPRFRAKCCAVPELVQDGVLQLLLHSIVPRVLHDLRQPRGAEANIPNRREERSPEDL
jgi:hypothetical protein